MQSGNLAIWQSKSWQSGNPAIQQSGNLNPAIAQSSNPWQSGNPAILAIQQSSPASISNATNPAIWQSKSMHQSAVVCITTHLVVLVPTPTPEKKLV